MKNYFQLSPEEQKALEENFLKGPDAFYEKAEDDQLKEALHRNYTERFFLMTRLMKLGVMLSNAKITYSDIPASK
jgi:hypothetical protein